MHLLEELIELELQYLQNSFMTRDAEYVGTWESGSQALLLLPGTFCQKLKSAWKGGEVKDTYFCQELFVKNEKCLERCEDIVLFTVIYHVRGLAWMIYKALEVI